MMITTTTSIGSRSIICIAAYYTTMNGAKVCRRRWYILLTMLYDGYNRWIGLRLLQTTCRMSHRPIWIVMSVRIVNAWAIICIVIERQRFRIIIIIIIIDGCACRA